MIIKPSTLDALTVSFNMDFEKGRSMAAPTWSAFAMEAPSNTSTQKYPLTGMHPRVREWVGDRVLKNVQAYDYTITNKKFEVSVEVPREDIEDDQYGLYSNAMTSMGGQVAYWPDDLCIDALIAGGASLCYDGQFFFDTDHPVDPYDAAKGVQANLLTTTALTEANYAAARAAMMNFKDENGKPMGVMGDLLIVPPALEKTAKTIVEAGNISQTGGSTQDNVFKGTARVLVVPRLTENSATTWYLIDSTKPIKPFIFQKRIAPEFQYITSLQSEHVIRRDTFVWGARMRGNAGYALWHLALKCTA